MYRFILLSFVCLMISGAGYQPNASGQHVVGFTADGKGWVIAKDTRFLARNIPNKMFEQLQDLSVRNRKIDAVGFAPGGGWTVVAGRATAARNVGGSYYQTLRSVIEDGHSVRAVAFNPVKWDKQRGFVIAHSGGFEAKNIPSELRQKLRAFYADGKTIDAIAFTPTGGWTIVFDRGAFTRGVGSTGKPGHASYFDRITALLSRAGARGESVAFNPSGYDRVRGYLIITDSGFEAQDVHPELVKKLEDVFGLKGVTRKTGATKTVRPRASLFKVRPGGQPSTQTAAPAQATTYQPITTTGAEIDLRSFEVQEAFERGGDEPYLVIYRFRGRLHETPRIHLMGLQMFKGDTGNAMYTNITGGRNWGRPGVEKDIFANAGRVTFNDLAPLEIYGVVVVAAESDGTSIDDQYVAYELLQKKLVARFDRAIPFNGPKERYTDLSKSNVNSIVSRSLKGLQEQFGKGLEDEVASTIRKWVGSRGDRFVGAHAVFYINAPSDLGPQPEFNATLSTAVIAQPGPFAIAYRERALSRLFRGEIVQAPHSGFRYAIRGLHRLW